MVLTATFEQAWVRATLARWGRYRSWVLFLGLPTVTPFFRMVVPSAGESTTDEILEGIDAVVNAAPVEIRRVLMVEYIDRGRLKAKAQKLGVTTFAYLRRVRRAERYVEAMIT